MQIGIPAELANHDGKTGIEHYATQLIQHLARIDRSNRYILYLATEPQAWLRNLPDNFELRVIPFPAAWTQVRVSSELWRTYPDVLFSLSPKLPIVHPARTVVTIHDAGFLRCPEFETSTALRYQPWKFRRLLGRAWRIIADSHATADDLVTLMPSAAERIRVVHLGYEQPEHNRARPTEDPRLDLPDRYILFLSTIQPRKNLVRLIDAFVALRRSHPELEHKLVIAGHLGWDYDAAVSKMEAHPDDVVYVGYVDDATRWSLYRHADLFVLPSLTEGFGLGVLEAFDAGTPVAVSSVTSLPEVAGEAALYFDPRKEAEIASTIEKGLTDTALRETLIAKGRVRLASFSWERCARETLAVVTDEG